jgi:adenine-specific DNA-methyltransferase
MSSGGDKMQDERQYSRIVGSAHLKKLGQFFTPYDIAECMCRWILKKDGNVLDPAIGNSIFFRTITKLSSRERELIGYEVDQKVIDYFDVCSTGEIRLADYLTSTWEEKFDCIICNPPYNKFQSIDDKDQIYECFAQNGYIGLSRYTNQYILFLIKSLEQLKEGGRLAYIIPSEFLNSKYGKRVKNILLDNRYLRAIINFQNDKDVFFNSLTTCCIILVEKTANDGKVEFVNIEDRDSISDLDFEASRICNSSMLLDYEQLKQQEKWLSFLKNEIVEEYENTVDCKTFLKATRGIATGDNDYFLFSISKARHNSISEKDLRPCICKSADAKRSFFTESDFNEIVENDRNAFLLDIKEPMDQNAEEYLLQGEETGVSKKYLPAHRKPWYKPEDGKIAPIWLVSAGRGEIKIVRNLAGLPNLTTFHGVLINDAYEDLTNVIFAYLLTPIGQSILKQNKKELGGGLDKFQPNDINNAKMLDIRLLSESDIAKINTIYKEMLDNGDKSEDQVMALNCIFEKLI